MGQDHARILETPGAIASLVRRVHRVAVRGIVPAWTSRPAYTVPAYMRDAGYDIVPVPVYFPLVTEILARRVYRALGDIPGPIDLVLLFRRAPDIPHHVDEIIATHPSAVWMQLGIRNDGAARRLVDAGIDVVQNRCFKIELMRLGR